jgi:hypothetical protein
METLTTAKLERIKKQVCVFEQKVGQLSYVPSGFFVADRTENNQPVVGLRMTACNKTMLGEWHLHHDMVERTEPGSKHIAFSKALNKFVDTGVAQIAAVLLGASVSSSASGLDPAAAANAAAAPLADASGAEAQGQLAVEPEASAAKVVKPNLAAVKAAAAKSGAAKKK